MSLRAKKNKPKKCKKCRAPFLPRDSFQVVCFSVDCAVAYVREQEAKLQNKKALEFRRETRAMRERAMKLGDWIKKVQKTFNTYIRLRDADKPCITCNRTNAEVQGTDGWKVGGAWDCGHFLSVGSHPNLRFEPDNAHKQCKSCNGGSDHFAGKGRTVTEAYRINVVHRIGAERVDALLADNTPRKYTIDDLKKLDAHFKGLITELKARVL